jgi:DNA-binding PadR family transcriptional regulator
LPIQHAVLALLAQGESYGYELKGEFEASVGPQWGGLNIGHLYQVLDRLVRDGLVTKREAPQPRRPDRQMFELTEAGERELREWLKAPAVRQTGYRDDVFLKLFAASRLGAAVLRRVLATQRQAYLGELSTLQSLRVEHRDEPLVDLLIEAAVLDAEAKLRVVELAEERQDSLLREARARRTLAARQSGARATG